MATVIPSKKLKKHKVGTFHKMGLSAPLLRGIQAMGYRLPTPIQRKTIPIILDGHDVVGMARTGSGKSAAFLIPLIANLKEHSMKVGIRGLILSPTRELALQTAKFAKSLSKYTDLRLCIVIGGESMEQQFDALSYNPDIVVATPGRISYVLKEVSTLNLRAVKYLIFDEADRLFEMGFAVQLKLILSQLSKVNKRQTMLFSATMPSSIAQFTRAALTNPVIVRLDTDTKISPDLQLSYLYCRHDEKLAVLLYLLRRLLHNDKLILIFAATRYHVELIEVFLRHNQIECLSCFGSMEQQYRSFAINRFRKKQINVMIVTDLASRGLDIPLLDYVINYQMSTTPKAFVHRVGRVARNGKRGIAVSIVEHDELAYVADIYRFLGHTLPNSESCAGNKETVTLTTFDEEDEDNDNFDEEEDESEGEEMGQDDNVQIDDDGMIIIEQDEDEEQEEEEENDLFSSVKEDNAEKESHPSLLFSDKISFGNFPSSILLPCVETVIDSFRKNDELNKLQETCTKAMDIYGRTKARPSKSGICDGKLINHRLIHPMFSNKIGAKELKTYKMLDNISTFKPNTTIFELGGASNPNYKMMQKTRKRFEYNTFKKISIKQKESSKMNSEHSRTKQLMHKQKYRNSEYFIESESQQSNNDKFVDDMLMVDSNKGDELKQFILELDDDERSAINTKKKLYRFNPNSKKYVTEYMGDRINRIMKEKNESSKNVNGSRHEYGKLYREWTMKSKRQIAINGSYEEKNDNANNNARLMGLRKHRHMRGSEEYYQGKRVQKRMNSMRNEKISKERLKKEKVKKFKREKFRKWWAKNRDRVKLRKGKRKMRAY